MNNNLGNKITFLSLIRYTTPTVIMMVFISLYTIIDGLFISNYVGSNALSSTNIIFPVVNFILGIGVMLGSGGSAIVAMFLGANKEKEARQSFSLLLLTSIIIGIIVAVFGVVNLKQIIYMLGSTENLYNDCYKYGFIMLLFAPVIMTKMFFDVFFVTAGKPKLGLTCAILGGVTNIILDYIFITKYNMGVSGAALATCIGNSITFVVGIIYFLNKNSYLHIERPKFEFSIILKSCTNGISEMITQLSSAITTFLYNIAMLKFIGEDGVAAITIVLYAQFLLVSAYLGFTSGVLPRISYNYGKKDNKELHKIIKYSFTFILILAVSIFIISKLLSEFLVSVFTGDNVAVYNITLHGFNIFSIGFLFSGFNIFTIGMFTAFSNGKISGLLSILRTLVLFLIGIYILPLMFQVNGVWLVVPFCEVLTILLSIFFIFKYKRVYKY